MGSPLTLALTANEDPLAPAVNEPWVRPEDITNCSTSDQVDLASVCLVASKILFMLSGRKYGIRTETIRPYAGERGFGWHDIRVLDAFAASNWLDMYNLNPGGREWLYLRSPVANIQQVKIDGAVLDPSQYILYDNRKLVRVASSANGLVGAWPIWQRVDLDDTNVGTFSINYQWGIPVPPEAKIAAASFACQLAKYMNRDSDCALPDRLISVTRQGVSQTLMDPSQFIKEARTGLYLVDIWLGAINPNGNRRRATISSVDDIDLLRTT